MESLAIAKPILLPAQHNFTNQSQSQNYTVLTKISVTIHKRSNMVRHAKVSLTPNVDERQR